MLTFAAAMTLAKTTTVYAVDAATDSFLDRPFADYDDALACANDFAMGGITATIRDFATGRKLATINP